ncbi:MAG: GH3 auxin-responsive promoter family protein, partial [Anaerotignaceae bacterium]
SWAKTRGLSLTNIKFSDLNGISYGAVSGKVREKYKDVEHYVYTSPLIATYPTGNYDVKYIHLRFALMEEDLSFITCAFLNSAVDFIKYLEQNWKIFVEDIREGKINENILIPQPQREILMEKIKPMEERGDFLKSEFKKGFSGILTRIWKNFKFVYGIGGGGFSVYAEKMRYYLGDAVLHQSIYSASEGIFATNLKPESNEMALILNSAFYEFIDINDETQTPITIDKVKVNTDYEIIITNLSGFYRYRIKDVVRVTGFLGTSPLIKFLYRQNQVISMAGEKTNDHIMNTTISDFCKKTNLNLTEYSLYADYDHSPVRYTVFIEAENVNMTIEEYEKLLNEELSKNNPSYGDKIKNGILAPLKIYFLRQNSYGVYRQLMIAKGTSAVQLKPVRLIDNPFRKNYFFSMIEKK